MINFVSFSENLMSYLNQNTNPIAATTAIVTTAACVAGIAFAAYKKRCSNRPLVITGHPIDLQAKLTIEQQTSKKIAFMSSPYLLGKTGSIY